MTALSIDTLLRRTSQPVNIAEQFFDANGAASCGWRFWRQRFRLNLTANGAVSRGVNPINGASNLTERLSASVAPRLEFRLADTFEISARAAIRYNQTRFSLQTTLNQTFWIYEYDGEMSVGLPQDWRINAAFDYSLYVSKSFGATQGVPILTASVSKFFGGRTLEMRLAVIDILNRNTGITRSADANFIQEETVRSLGRYALLTATYSFNRGKSKKEFRTAD